MDSQKEGILCIMYMMYAVTTAYKLLSQIELYASNVREVGTE